MEIKPTNEVRLYKNVPFYIDYKNVVLFDNTAKQEEYFNSLPSLEFNNVTYTRAYGQIKVKAERDSLLEYNYMSFTNKNYTNKTFYAFITSATYVNPNTTLISFVIDEWQTWCFDLTFKESFIERKHCKRWNSDGTPVINTQDEGLDFGSEYIVKDHREYNNNLYWLCFVTSVDEYGYQIVNNPDVPTILSIFYAPIYKQTNRTIIDWRLKNTGTTYFAMTNVTNALTKFRNGTALNGKLRSCYIISEPPFNYTYEITSDNIINISAPDVLQASLLIDNGGTDKINLGLYVSTKNPASTLRTFPKYGNLKNNITESKLLMYPYSFVQIVDGQGNTFDIKNEYLNDTSINIRTFTSSGLNSKQAHILEHYRYKDITLNYCRWELGNGIINSFPNNLTVIDDYSSAYLQGNSNQINASISNTMNQSTLNNVIANNNARTSLEATNIRALGNTVNSILQSNDLVSMASRAVGTGVQNISEIEATRLENENTVKNTELQGNLTNEKTIRTALAKKQDAKNVADNVALQGGDVYFTFQNQYNGYCLVYKQISDEYIRVLEDFFKKFGYAYNRVEIPNLHTRKSWDYIRTVDCNINANINNESLEKIKTIFDNGVTIWHTTDVDNYSLNNDEI